MAPVVSAAYKSWFKSASNIKLSSDAAATEITHEGVTNFSSLQDFDKKSIESVPSTCKEKIPAVATQRNLKFLEQTSLPFQSAS